jgi:hypothetical protein
MQGVEKMWSSVVAVLAQVKSFVLEKPWMALTCALALGMGYMYLQAAGAKERADRLALEKSNAVAEADSTKLKFENYRNSIGETLDIYSRRIVQTEVKNETLEDSLNTTLRSNSRLEAQIASLDTTVTGETTEDSVGVRQAEFEGYQEPYFYTALVTVPPPPETPEMSLHVESDPIPLQIFVGCGEPEDEIRPATLNVGTPDWAEVNLTDLSQDPDVCNPDLGGSVIGSSGLFNLGIDAEPVAGALGGAAAGYLLSDEDDDALANTAVGAATGGVSGWLLGKLGILK